MSGCFSQLAVIFVLYNLATDGFSFEAIVTFLLVALVLAVLDNTNTQQGIRNDMKKHVKSINDAIATNVDHLKES